jgi:ABC-type polysaccharide/polyol phosphate export permease
MQLARASKSLEREIWVNRGIIRSFVRRELRSRFAGSALGVFWSVIQPLLILLLYIIVFSTLTRGGNFSVRGHIVSYALFLCPAILAWNWFSESLLGACSSITHNSTLIKKVHFPAGVLPLSALITGLVPFVATMLVFLVFALWAGGVPYRLWLLLPPVMCLQFALMIGLAYLLAALNVFLRDTIHVLTALIQFLFWGSPIVYSQETLTSNLPWTRIWFAINPIAHLMDVYRDILLAGRLPSPGSILYLLFVSIIAYQAGKALFTRGRRFFPDEV